MNKLPIQVYIGIFGLLAIIMRYVMELQVGQTVFDPRKDMQDGDGEMGLWERTAKNLADPIDPSDVFDPIDVQTEYAVQEAMSAEQPAPTPPQIQGGGVSPSLRGEAQGLVPSRPFIVPDDVEDASAEGTPAQTEGKSARSAAKQPSRSPVSQAQWEKKQVFADKFLAAQEGGSDRSKFGLLLNELGLRGAGAELGVFKGHYAEEILGTWQTGEYHMVEPSVTGELKGRLERWARQYPGRFKLDKGFSFALASSFPDEYFDYIYVDAGHGYKEVAVDVKDWWPKLKKGGLFAGHDYCTSLSQRKDGAAKGRGWLAQRPWCGPKKSDNEHGPEKLGWEGTIRAVDEFAAQVHRRVSFTLEGRSPQNPYITKGRRNASWYFFK